MFAVKRISCAYNIDTACVEIKYDNGVTIQGLKGYVYFRLKQHQETKRELLS